MHNSLLYPGSVRHLVRAVAPGHLNRFVVADRSTVHHVDCTVCLNFASAFNFQAWLVRTVRVFPELRAACHSKVVERSITGQASCNDVIGFLCPTFSRVFTTEVCNFLIRTLCPCTCVENCICSLSKDALAFLLQIGDFKLLCIDAVNQLLNVSQGLSSVRFQASDTSNDIIANCLHSLTVNNQEQAGHVRRSRVVVANEHCPVIFVVCIPEVPVVF